MTAVPQFTAITTCSRAYAASAGVPAGMGAGMSTKRTQETQPATPLARSRKSRSLRISLLTSH
jgi:hypothetical protein